MALSIRSRLTLWYFLAVALIFVLLGTALYWGARLSLQRAADRELISGINNIAAFLQHKYDTHDIKHLADELREHSSLSPRGKLSRIGFAGGPILYVSDGMQLVAPLPVSLGKTSRRDLQITGRPLRVFSTLRRAGPSLFQIDVAVDQTDYFEILRGLAWLLILSMPLVAIFAALVGYWISGRSLTPIQNIIETAARIDAENLAVRLPLLGNGDELDRLSHTLNSMFDRIEAAYARIKQFTADASHELRTPVALIQANGEYVLMEPRDEARMIRGIKDMLKESAYMTQLINDLLTLARSDQATASPLTEIVELEDAIAEVIPRIHPAVSAKNIELVCHRPHHVVAVRGDRFELQRIAMILIENAVRYTPAGGAVIITFWSNQISCGFVVKDSGVGIAPEDCKRIFQRFYRVNSVRTPGDGGTGLGLAIANGLVTAHGGTIEVQSELGKGSCFTVHLPRAEFLHASSVFATLRPPPISNASR